MDAVIHMLNIAALMPQLIRLVHSHGLIAA